VLLRPELHGTRDAVASTHWLASATGAAMFERGGNAFDAATAAAFVLQVVEPHLNGPAGDVPILVYSADNDRVDVVCGQGPMPMAATITAFRDRGLVAVPGSGLLAATVPGVFGAWMRLLRDYGRLTLGEVLEPAIGYAENGYPLLPEAGMTIRALAPLFRQEWTESARTYLPGGVVPAPGARMRNVTLAATFRRIVTEARAGSVGREAEIDAAVAAFYRGFVAEAIGRFVADSEPIDSTGRHNAGLLTSDDLVDWSATVEEPVELSYGQYRVYKPGPWSQGPVFLQQLALLDGTDVATMGFASVDHLHTVVESAKLAFADRDAWYGDPRYADVPMAELLDRRYADSRRRLVGPDAAAELQPGSPAGAKPWIPELPQPLPVASSPAGIAHLVSGGPLAQVITGSGDTCCVSAADHQGNMVVATPSGGWLKSSPVIPGLGFSLGTRGQMTWLVEGHNNSLAPGKRPRTTLSPTVVLRDGRPYLAFGTPGGDQQDQWTLSFLLNHIEFGMSLQVAAEAVAFHTGHLVSSFAPRRVRPRSLVIEGDADPEVIEELRRRGHEVEIASPLSLGMICATGVSSDGGVVAAASPRGNQAYAVVR
jgi:gamma-glutamyltranspeptidase/glutathione hydrolase